MNFSSFNSRLSFQVKVLLPVVTVMVLLVAGTMWLINRRISEQLEAEATQLLKTANSIFQISQTNRITDLKQQFANFRGDVRYKALLQTKDTKTADGVLRDLLKELGDESRVAVINCTFANDELHGFASASRDPVLNTNEFQAKSSAAIKRALEGQTVVDTISVGQKLFYAVCIPVGDMYSDRAGVITFGVPLGAEAGLEIRQFAHSQIVLFADGQVAVASVPKPELNPDMVSRFNELSLEVPVQKSNLTHRILIGDQHFVCTAGHFDSLNNTRGIGYLLLSSYDEPLKFLQATQQRLLLVGLFGIGLSTLVVWWLIGRVTRPLRQLRDSAVAVGHGDFSRRVEINSQDEFGGLAVAFNQMTENVQASRVELEKTVETLKATQNQLIQSEKLSGIGEFVAGVAHELNNPLTSVMGFAELLQQSDMPEQQRRYLDVIFKSAKRCQKIVQSLLSFARRHAPERKVVSVNEIVDSAVEILQYQMRTSNIEVLTHLDPALPASDVDPHQMQQVFLNIINNARQAMEGRDEKSWLRVTTKLVEDRVQIIFEDNGPGIPEENLKKIFNPFFTTKEVGKGTGLGLSLCYGIVSEHGGTITPYSEPGKGATFVIDLPVAKQTAKAADKKNSGPIALPATREGVGKRVLVIDDEDAILQMIREALMRNGYRVDVVRDGESALRRLGQYHYDLALCDWKMPGLNGQQIYERLHDSNPEMSQRLIFITGDIVNEKTQEFLKSQGKVCLSKPFTLGEFRTAISRVMAAGGE